MTKRFPTEYARAERATCSHALEVGNGWSHGDRVKAPEPVIERFAEAHLHPDRLGLAVTYHQAADGAWRATLDLDELILLADLALNRKDAA